MWWWDTDDQILIYRRELFFLYFTVERFLWSNFLSLKAHVQTTCGMNVLWWYGMISWIYNIWYEVKSSVSCIIMCRIMVFRISFVQTCFYSPWHHHRRWFPFASKCSHDAWVKDFMKFFFFYKSQFMLRQWPTYISSLFWCVRNVYKLIKMSPSCLLVKIFHADRRPRTSWGGRTIHSSWPRNALGSLGKSWRLWLRRHLDFTN